MNTESNAAVSSNYISMRRRHMQLQRRRAVFIKKLSLFIAAVTIIISLSSIIIVHASDNINHKLPQNNKYYTSIDIQNNDTLWNLAEQYSGSHSTAEINKYVREVKQLNGLDNDCIYQGQHLIVYYYSTEVL